MEMRSHSAREVSRGNEETAQVLPAHVSLRREKNSQFLRNAVVRFCVRNKRRAKSSAVPLLPPPQPPLLRRKVTVDHPT